LTDPKANRLISVISPGKNIQGLPQNISHQQIDSFIESSRFAENILSGKGKKQSNYRWVCSAEKNKWRFI